jgi:hypothetical protein
MRKMVSWTAACAGVCGLALPVLTGCSSNNPSAEDAAAFYRTQGAKEPGGGDERDNVPATKTDGQTR